MTAELWRAFAWRTFWIWVAVHALAAVATALVSALAGVVPSGPGPEQGAWMIAMTATVLGVDIARSRERLLLHDLGVRQRVLIPLAVAPAALLEVVILVARLNAG